MQRYLTRCEKFIAVAAFTVATLLSFTALLISSDHEIAAGVCMVIAQFLILCAAAMHIDLKLKSYETTFRNDKQQPVEHSGE